MSSIEVFHQIHSPQEGFDRTVRVYLPDAYFADDHRRFPVLYMHDGQNVFAHPASARLDTWCANWSMDRLAHDNAIEPWVIVAIDHGVSRFSEYSVWDQQETGSVGRGYHYLRFLVETLKPLVDHHYRTRADAPSTAIMGASLGGLISLAAGLHFPHVFGRIGGMSPTVMWAHGAIFREWRHHSHQWTRIYLDAGSEEVIYVNGMRLDYAGATWAFYNHLAHLGYAPHELALHLEEGGEHHETDWQRRLPDAWRFLLA